MTVCGVCCGDAAKIGLDNVNPAVFACPVKEELGVKPHAVVWVSLTDGWVCHGDVTKRPPKEKLVYEGRGVLGH